MYGKDDCVSAWLCVYMVIPWLCLGRKGSCASQEIMAMTAEWCWSNRLHAVLQLCSIYCAYFISSFISGSTELGSSTLLCTKYSHTHYCNVQLFTLTVHLHICTHWFYLYQCFIYVILPHQHVWSRMFWASCRQSCCDFDFSQRGCLRDVRLAVALQNQINFIF